jgi:hypothetical protein
MTLERPRLPQNKHLAAPKIAGERYSPHVATLKVVGTVQSNIQAMLCTICHSMPSSDVQISSFHSATAEKSPLPDIKCSCWGELSTSAVHTPSRTFAGEEEALPARSTTPAQAEEVKEQRKIADALVPGITFGPAKPTCAQYTESL